jgi:hypothetical protein
MLQRLRSPAVLLRQRPGRLRHATRRVGLTLEDHARWLIALGYRYETVEDWTTLPLEEVDAILAQMAVFLSDDPAHPDETKLGDFPEQYALRWLIRIRNGVRRLAKGRAWSHALVTHRNFWVPRAGQQAGSVYYSPGRIEPKQPNVLHTSQTHKDLMAHRICETLAAAESRIRRCPRRGCGHLFVAHRRQLYCKKTCGWVTRTRRSRAKRHKTGPGEPHNGTKSRH